MVYYLLLWLGLEIFSNLGESLEHSFLARFFYLQSICEMDQIRFFKHFDFTHHFDHG